MDVATVTGIGGARVCTGGIRTKVDAPKHIGTAQSDRTWGVESTTVVYKSEHLDVFDSIARFDPIEPHQIAMTLISTEVGSVLTCLVALTKPIVVAHSVEEDLVSPA